MTFQQLRRRAMGAYGVQALTLGGGFGGPDDAGLPIADSARSPR